MGNSGWINYKNRRTVVQRVKSVFFRKHDREHAGGFQWANNTIAAYRTHAAALVSPKFFLFVDRAGLGRAEDFLDYPWLDAAGEQHRLLD